jgi:serine/threonine protein kinase/Tfp pilus assembly protein PilF
MPLDPGTRLGPYEILDPLGAGGMGEVYRARDTRLDRTVAIKSLSGAFAGDPGHLARFEREAKVLASLNHPNIAAIYGLEEHAGSPHLVLELVEGETLAQVLVRGPLTVSEALQVCGEIAGALEAAHERGIVHRDLKPGNVMLTASRTVKVLDFGLAKGQAATDDSSAILTATPTTPAFSTGEGLILGTAPYMSPEQARGKPVDRRADVWAFGCVLYECLSGRAAFAGETVSDVIAKILEREPDWSTLPPAVPPRLRTLLGRCLTKDVQQRPRDIGDLRRELNAIALEMSSPKVSRTAAADRPSLAVLYFENLSTDKESEYFCAGITEDILTDLSKIKGLRVASRNAVAKYRGESVEIARVASELGVRAVLEGSVRKAGDRVRISAQLVNGTDGFHLWADRYDRTLEDVFAVQEEIASAIAQALKVALTPSEVRKLVEDRPQDVRAYDLYLKGREQYGQYTPEAMRNALELFQEAIGVDPNYALAWAGIADAHGQMLQIGMSENPEENTRAGLEAAERAIAINPKLAEGYKAKSLVLRFSGDREGSNAVLAQALEVNPRFTPALINIAVEEFCRADVAGAERYIRRVLEIDPQESFATTWLAWIMTYTGRWEEAAAIGRRQRSLSDNPTYVSASYGFQLLAAQVAGDLDGARDVYRRAADDVTDKSNLKVMEASIALSGGDLETARKIARELWDDRGVGGGPLLDLAQIELAAGDPDAARHFLERGFVRDLAPVAVRLLPSLRPVLGSPPFTPRQLDAVLVWPLEAPMPDRDMLPLFREIRIETGIPEASGVQPA